MTEVVVNPAPAKNLKTGVGGVLLIVGIVVDELRAGVWPEDLAGWVGFAAKVIGAGVLAWFARDKNISSEGQKVEVVKP